MKRISVLVTFLISLLKLSAQYAVGITSGPVVGHTTTTTSKIWVLAEKVDLVTILLIDQKKCDTISEIISTDSVFCLNNVCPVTFNFKNLKPETEYLIVIKTNKGISNIKSKVTTLSEAKINDFSFLTGSCALSFKGIMKPIYGTFNETIFTRMKETPADFMVWLGDNVYYLGKDYLSSEGMFRRQAAKRKTKKLKHFFQSGLPQYAIWDDHDFGPNNGNSNFNLKEEALKVQQLFWPNPYYGTLETKGAFSKFTVYDADFFLLDDRYHKTSENSSPKTMLGTKQLNWFLESLKNSTATFKFIAMGSQAIPTQPHECLSDYPEEKKKIIDFLNMHHITGIIFLTGDIHHTVLSRTKINETQSIYDYTSSPLTTLVYPMKNATEIYKETMVEGTLLFKNNYGRIALSGELGNRICTFEAYTKKGMKVWEHKVYEKELRHCEEIKCTKQTK